jgi:hypothetical protein
MSGTERPKISLADWSEPACRAAMAELINCMRPGYGGADLDVSFVVGGQSLTHRDFFARLVATGLDLSREYSFLAEIYLDGPWSFSFGAPSHARGEEAAQSRGWRRRLARAAIETVGLPDEAMISLLLSTDAASHLQVKLAKAAASDFRDGSTTVRAKFRDEIILNLYEKQGWHTVESIKRGLERSLCECDGNPAFIRPGLMESASNLLSIHDFVGLLTDRASNLPWRLAGYERWTADDYLNLFREGLEQRSRRSKHRQVAPAVDAYERGVALFLKQGR